MRLSLHANIEACWKAALGGDENLRIEMYRLIRQALDKKAYREYGDLPHVDVDEIAGQAFIQLYELGLSTEKSPMSLGYIILKHRMSDYIRSRFQTYETSTIDENTDEPIVIKRLIVESRAVEPVDSSKRTTIFDTTAVDEHGISMLEDSGSKSEKVALLFHGLRNSNKICKFYIIAIFSDLRKETIKMFEERFPGMSREAIDTAMYRCRLEARRILSRYTFKKEVNHG